MTDILGKDYLTREEAAHYACLSLRKWDEVRATAGIPAIPWGGKVVFRRADINQVFDGIDPGPEIDEALAGFRKWQYPLLAQSRKNAKTRGIEFALALDDLERLFLEAGGRCALTGIAFNFSSDAVRGRRPWVPSIDRKDSALGYTVDNCRLVCAAVNIALGVWGDAVLLEISKAMVTRYVPQP